MKHMVTDITVHIGLQEAELALRLNSAAFNGDLSLIKSLIRSGADPNKKDYDGRSPLVCFSINNLTRKITDYITYQQVVGMHEQHLAASKGHMDIVLFLLQSSVEVNVSGRHPSSLSS